MTYFWDSGSAEQAQEISFKLQKALHSRGYEQPVKKIVFEKCHFRRF